MSLANQFSDEELGFIGAAGAAAGKLVGGMAKGLGKAFKKKKKKKPPALPAPTVPGASANAPDRPGYLMPLNQSTETKAALQAIVKGAAKAKTKAKAKGVPDATAREIVAQIVAAVPTAVREQVLTAIKESSNAKAAQTQTLSNITEQVDDALKPQITAMLAALQAQGISKQATNEHLDLVKKADFERTVTDGLRNALTRMDALEKNLAFQLRNPKLAVVTTKLPIFGPKNVLEG